MSIWSKDSGTASSNYAYICEDTPSIHIGTEVVTGTYVHTHKYAKKWRTGEIGASHIQFKFKCCVVYAGAPETG